MTPFLVSLGWNDFFQKSFDENPVADHFPARIVGQARGHYYLQGAPGEAVEALITGPFRKMAKLSVNLPAVGDWVVFSRGPGNQNAEIHRILTRKNVVQRRRARAPQDSQLIVANVDFMLIVVSLNEDFDLRRIGRYLEIVAESGATPALLLTKSDLCENPQGYVERVKKEFGALEVFTSSNHEASFAEPLAKFFGAGMTSVLLGSSGVGKSTLTNGLRGVSSEKTRGVSSESKGRHTTTARNLLGTRFGGFVIDTPGMTDVTTVNLGKEASPSFAVVDALTLQCKFTNCRHGNEPGCAVAAALKTGSLAVETWQDYLEKSRTDRR